MIAIYRAYKGHQVRIAAATGETATIIMSKVIGHLQNADESIQSSVLDSGNKIEKLQTSTSKTKISFKGGGCVEIVTLGGNSVDPKKTIMLSVRAEIILLTKRPKSVKMRMPR